jgi:hypothetical protein
VGLNPSEIQPQMRLLYQPLMTDTEHCWTNFWQGKTKVTGEQTVAAPLCPLHIPHR